MQSEQINEIAAALAKAQGQIKNPSKNAKVKVRTRSGHEFEFAYATLDVITDAVRVPLSSNNIAISHSMEEREGRNRLITKLIHSSGQWVGTSRPMFVAEQTSQALMSAETYAKRGNICALVNVSADTDDDANAGDGNVAKFQNGNKRENPNVNRQQDFAENEVQYDAQGNPVDNIPFGNPALQPLRTTAARKEYEDLQKEIISITDIETLRKWANLSKTKDRVQTLPGEWPQHLRDLYEGHKKQLEKEPAHQ